jgi:hypothetical protein
MLLNIIRTSSCVIGAPEEPNDDSDETESVREDDEDEEFDEADEKECGIWPESYQEVRMESREEEYLGPMVCAPLLQEPSQMHMLVRMKAVHVGRVAVSSLVIADLAKRRKTQVRRLVREQTGTLDGGVVPLD